MNSHSPNNRHKKTFRHPPSRMYRFHRDQFSGQTGAREKTTSPGELPQRRALKVMSLYKTLPRQQR
jgi:hypothetical protein